MPDTIILFENDEPMDMPADENSECDPDDSELWELLPDREPAPFIAGRYEAEGVQANIAVVGSVNADDVQANLSAIGMAKSDWFESMGSAIAFASIQGDADINTSAVPLLYAKGDVHFHQAYASAVIAGDTVQVHQGGSPLMLAKRLKIKQGGAGVIVAGEAKVKSGFVGMLLAREATISDDSRVLVDSKSAAIVGAALLGGLGLVAFGLARGLAGMRRGHRRG